MLVSVHFGAILRHYRLPFSPLTVLISGSAFPTIRLFLFRSDNASCCVRNGHYRKSPLPIPTRKARHPCGKQLPSMYRLYALLLFWRMISWSRQGLSRHWTCWHGFWLRLDKPMLFSKTRGRAPHASPSPLPVPMSLPFLLMKTASSLRKFHRTQTSFT